MKIKYIHSHYEVDISNEEAEYYEKTVSLKLLAIVLIDFKPYSRYYLKQGSWFVCSNF